MDLSKHTVGTLVRSTGGKSSGRYGVIEKVWAPHGASVLRTDCNGKPTPDKIRGYCGGLSELHIWITDLSHWEIVPAIQHQLNED